MFTGVHVGPVAPLGNVVQDKPITCTHDAEMQAQQRMIGAAEVDSSILVNGQSLPSTPCRAIAAVLSCYRSACRHARAPWPAAAALA